MPSTAAVVAHVRAVPSHAADVENGRGLLSPVDPVVNSPMGYVHFEASEECALEWRDRNSITRLRLSVRTSPIYVRCTALVGSSS